MQNPATAGPDELLGQPDSIDIVTEKHRGSPGRDNRRGRREALGRGHRENHQTRRGSDAGETAGAKSANRSCRDAAAERWPMKHGTAEDECTAGDQRNETRRARPHRRAVTQERDAADDGDDAQRHDEGTRKPGQRSPSKESTHW